MYNASNNELVRTKTLVKNAVVQIDATPFKQWYECHYGQPLGRKKGHKAGEMEDDPLTKPRSHHLQRKIDARKPGRQGHYFCLIKQMQTKARRISRRTWELKG